MMVEDPLKTRIEKFVRRVGEHVDEKYEKVEGVTPQKLNQIQQGRYIHRVIGHSDDTKTEILKVLEESWDARIKNGEEHGNRRDWGRAASGFAYYLLKPMEIDQVDIDAAADLVARISRWHHSNEYCNLWKRFIPYAHRIVELAWGSIDNKWD